MNTRKYCFASLLLISASGCSAAVSDEKVKKWIAHALDQSSSRPDVATSIAKPWSQSSVLAAWRRLKQCRDAGQSLDLELASAEHYLFIRSFASEKGEKDVEALPALYGSLKQGLGPAAQLLKTSDQPVSPVDASVIAWGKKGVQDGLDDFIRINKKAPKEKTGQFRQYKLAADGYYDNYFQAGLEGGCKVKP